MAAAQMKLIWACPTGPRACWRSPAWPLASGRPARVPGAPRSEGDLSRPSGALDKDPWRRLAGAVADRCARL